MTTLLLSTALLAPGVLLLTLVLVWPLLVMLGMSLREHFPGPLTFSLARYAEWHATPSPRTASRPSSCSTVSCGTNTRSCGFAAHAARSASAST